MKLSVYYIVKNESARLGESLAKVATFVDEIIVVDSGSTDDTVEIAMRYGARVSFHDWQGFAVQKAHAASLCSHDWVLEIDADEVPSDALIASLRTLSKRNDLEDYAGFEITWSHVPPFPGHPMRYAPSMHIMRLYHRQRAAIRPVAHTIDDRARVIRGKVGRLDGVMYHRPVLSLAQMERKFQVLSSDQAAEYVAKGRHISTLRLVLEFPTKFLKYYLLRGNYRNGWYGFSVSIICAYRNFMRLAKAKDMLLNKEER